MKAQHKKLNKYVRKQIRQWLEDGWSERAVSDELGIDSERVRHFRAWNMETSLDKTSPEAYMDIWFLRYGWRLEADFRNRSASGMYNAYVDKRLKEWGE